MRNLRWLVPIFAVIKGWEGTSQDFDAAAIERALQQALEPKSTSSPVSTIPRGNVRTPEILFIP